MLCRSTSYLVFLFLFPLFLPCELLAQAPSRFIEVFKKGDAGYHTFRIPAIVQTKQGTLLAFAEARKDGRGDAGNIDMVVSRSEDQGKTWSSPLIIWDDGTNTCGNAAPVVDQETGTIWLLLTWNLGSDHEREILAATSESPRMVYVSSSTDDGLTWSNPKDISNATRQDHWRWYATGPGNAIQLKKGNHRGRLLIPANHSDHLDKSKHHYRSHVFYSDDHGLTWQLGAVQDEKTNESAVVELSDGRVMQIMRSYHGTNQRAVGISSDGGESWDKQYLEEDLFTPVCQASAIRFSWPEAESPSRLLFSSPKGKQRADMHVWVSYDEGESWPVSKRIYEGGSAYSNLVKLSEIQVGLLFEKDGYASIAFTRFGIDWLEADAR